MHKSRLAGFIIDCNTGDLDAAASFWTQALGYGLASVDWDPGIYRTFDTGPNGLHIEVQKVEARIEARREDVLRLAAEVEELRIDSFRIQQIQQQLQDLIQQLDASLERTQRRHDQLSAE